MQGVFTKILNLWIPNKTYKGTVVTDVFEPNFTKLDQYAEATNQTLEDLKSNKLDKYKYVTNIISDYDDIIEDGFYIARGLNQGVINAPYGDPALVQVWSYGDFVYQSAVSYYDVEQQFTRCFKKGIKNTKWESINRIASTTQLGKIKVGTNLRIDASGFLHGNPDVDISGKLDKGTYSGNASNLKVEIDLNLVKILGLEFGGELNNNNLKQVGKAYWDNVNKSIYKCLVDTTLDYADSNYYEGISNNDLLLKLQNLFNFRTASVSNTFGIFNFYSFGYFAMCSIVNLDTKDYVSKKTVVSKDEIPSWFATRTKEVNFSISGVDQQRVGSLECVFNNDSGILVWGNAQSASGQFSMILDKN